MKAGILLAAVGTLIPLSAHALERQPLVFSAWTDRLEYQAGQGKDAFLWDANAWLGKDLNKAWFRTEGSVTDGTVEDGEAELLWSHAIAPFWDVQSGVRQDFGQGPDRTHAVLGFEGIAPGWFEVTADLFVSQKGDVTARLEAEYDMLITERLILQPRTEINIAFQGIPALRTGQGLSDFSLDLRLRYKIRQEVAPYIGVSWTRKVGDTADFARLAGERVGTLAFVTGVRLEY
jgi:copper resistance protein B